MGRRLVRLYRYCRTGCRRDLSGAISRPASSSNSAHVAAAIDKTARQARGQFCRAVAHSRATLETLLNSMQDAVIAVSSEVTVYVGESAHGAAAVPEGYG